MPGIIDETPLTLRGQQAGADHPQGLRALDGERLRRRFAALAELLEREPEIRIGKLIAHEPCASLVSGAQRATIFLLD